MQIACCADTNIEEKNDENPYSLFQPERKFLG